MNSRISTLAAVSGLLLTACSSTLPATPSPTAATDAMLGPEVADASGMLQSALGAWTLHVDPATSTASIEPLRQSSLILYGQGQNYLLSVRPFLNPGDVSVQGVDIEPGGEVRVVVRVQHPFDIPTDTTRPATAAKRLDLHVAEAHLMLVADGTDDFFEGLPGGTVTVNHGLLTNADAFRDPGPLFDPAGFGIASATAFPYRMVGDYDALDPNGNYDPLSNGWQGANLLAPTGYGVFPMGADKTVDLVLDISDGQSIDVGLVFLAKYQDPRGGTMATEKRANRLPDPVDPTALRYHMPQGAGDLERIFIGPIAPMDDSASGTTTVFSDVLDWDQGAAVIAPTAWPDNSDLSKIPEPSGVESAEASVPQLDNDGVFTGTAIPPVADGPTVDVSVTLDNRDNLDVPPAGATVQGLLRVIDQQDNDDVDTGGEGVINQVLGEDSTVPLPGPHPNVPTVRYQAFNVTVDDATPPANTFVFQSQEVAVNAEASHAFKSIGWDSFDLKQLVAADQQGDVYLFYRWFAAPNTWFVSRTANGGDSWGLPTAIPTPALGLTLDNTLTMATSCLFTGATGSPIIAATEKLATPNSFFFLKGTDSGTNVTTWSATAGSVIAPSGNFRVAAINGDPTDFTGNRAYAMVRSDVAANRQLLLYRTTNAQIASPTWTLLGPIDDNGAATSEDEPVVVIDLAGNLHCAWRAAPNDIFYRKITSPATTPVFGTVVNVSNSGADNVVNVKLLPDSTGRALIVYEQWIGGNSSAGNVYIVRGDATGATFSAPLEIDPAATDHERPDVIVDLAGRVVVAYNAPTAGAMGIYLTALTADLSTVLVPATPAHTDIPSASVDYPRLGLDIVRNRMLVIYRRNGGLSDPLAVPDKNYLIRSRWFTIM